jgi:hypothetical protein
VLVGKWIRCYSKNPKLIRLNLDYQKFERSLTTLLATLLTKQELEDFVKTVQERLKQEQEEDDQAGCECYPIDRASGEEIFGYYQGFQNERNFTRKWKQSTNVSKKQEREIEKKGGGGIRIVYETKFGW